MPRVVDIPLPEVFEPLLKPIRYKGLYGGRGSGKSHFLADQLIDDAIVHAPLRAVCIREYQVNLKQSVKLLLEDKIKQYGLGREFRVKESSIITPEGGEIIFQGMQSHNADSIKSLEGFHRAWVEEAQNLSARSLELLRPTLRTDDSEIWFSWNPYSPKDPVDKFLREEKPVDSIAISSSYKDNPFFPDVLRREMEHDRARDIDKFNHVWMGAYAQRSHAQVFKNWRIEAFDVPEDAEFLLGGDFGFANDPDVLVAVYIIGRTLYIPYEAYKVGCEIDDTPVLFDTVGCRQNHYHPTTAGEQQVFGKCDGFARHFSLVADSARPETISYLQRHGYPRCEAAHKGPGSVEEGIKFLKNYDIVVHPRCRYTIEEFTDYSYKIHSLTGEVLPVLHDKKNHVIDAIRYSVEPVRNPTHDFVSW